MSYPAQLSRRNCASLSCSSWKAPLPMLPRLRTAKSPRMTAATEEFLGVDADGNPIKLTLPAKEKLYLDACSAFHNDGKELIPNDEYDKLKADLAFEGSAVALMSREEILFMVAASRLQEGKPIMSDPEFDSLRRKLKSQNSPAVLHKVRLASHTLLLPLVC